MTKAEKAFWDESRIDELKFMLRLGYQWVATRKRGTQRCVSYGTLDGISLPDGWEFVDEPILIAEMLEALGVDNTVTYGHDRLGQYMRSVAEYEKSILRSRKAMWSSKNRAVVSHSEFGEVVVPCASKQSALECACEVWGCSMLEIACASVMRAPDGSRCSFVPEDI